VVSSTPWAHFTPGKDPVPILQEAGWAPGPVWTGEKSRPHRHSIPDRPDRSSDSIPTELPGPQRLFIESNNGMASEYIISKGIGINGVYIICSTILILLWSE